MPRPLPVLDLLTPHQNASIHGLPATLPRCEAFLEQTGDPDYNLTDSPERARVSSVTLILAVSPRRVVLVLPSFENELLFWVAL